MDYSVGSLADLISGTNTENKPKVIQKKFKLQPKKATSEEKSPKQKRKNAKVNDNDQINIQNTNHSLNNPLKKKNKKRKATQTNNNNNDNIDAPNDSNENNKLVNAKKKKINKVINEVTSDENNKSSKKKAKKHQIATEVNTVNNIEPSKKKKKTEISETEDINEDTNEIDENNTVIKKKSKKRKKSETSAAENVQRRLDEKNKEEHKPQLNPEHEQRTVFVGNVPKGMKKIKITRLFKKFGNVEAVRIRSIAIANPKVPKKIAICKNELHPDRSSVNAFVRFDSREAAIKALAVNGKLVQEHHLRVKLVVADDSTKSKQNPKKAIFIGNVPFDAEDEDLWKLFSSCGEIESVRLIRDSKTNIGKGFGYVNFKTKDAVELALQMEDVKLGKRVLRIHRDGENVPKKRDASGKKIRKNRPSKENVEKSADNGAIQTTDSVADSKAYQGFKLSEKKKKKKFNKGELNKKRLVKKIAPK